MWFFGCIAICLEHVGGYSALGLVNELSCSFAVADLRCSPQSKTCGCVIHTFSMNE